MKSAFRSIVIFILLAVPCYGQDVFRNEYHLKLKADIPVIVAGIAGTLAGFHFREAKKQCDSTEIACLDPNQLKPYQRRVTTQYGRVAGKVSDYFMAGGFVLPFTLLFDDQIRANSGKMGLLYLETMALTGLGYWGSAAIFNKYRPYAYNKNVDFDKRRSKHSKDSFYSGHVSVTAAGTFFMAKVYSDLYPDCNTKYGLWTFASLATATNFYLRYRGGYHFPEDLVVGALAGALIGVLVPELHKRTVKVDPVEKKFSAPAFCVSFKF
jgi:membrane-associated phospholipid phosphatase